MARRGGYRRGPYKFTSRRRAALKKAQIKSARNRKSKGGTAKKIGIAAGAIGGIAVAAYLGSKSGGFSRNNRGGSARAAVQPGSKEKTRVANAISVGSPSRTTVISPDALRRAQNERNKLARATPVPAHMRGATDRQTERGVRKTLRDAKKQAVGQKTSSLTGTPGGVKTPSKAKPQNEARNKAWTDQQWADALAFDAPTRNPLSGGPVKRNSAGTPIPFRDPMHSLAKMRFEDEKLLRG
jgi:hypothetical protein